MLEPSQLLILYLFESNLVLRCCDRGTNQAEEQERGPRESMMMFGASGGLVFLNV